MRVCKICSTTENMAKDRRLCKPCYSKQRAAQQKDDPKRKLAKKAYYERTKDSTKEQRVWSLLKARYGVTQEWYESQLEIQDGLCAICHKPCKTGQRLVVDHNHDTKRVRGLLCKSCNLHLGVLEREIWVAKAKQYLQNYDQ